MNSDWPWPDTLDALVAAPAHHRLLFENEFVRVLDTRIAAGDRTPIHTHRWPAAHFVLSWSDFVRRDPEGGVMADTRALKAGAPSPEVQWGSALPPHSLENVGTAEIHIISTEVKSASDKC